MSVRVFAPAKINLTLQVGAPRADGLHPLHSIVAFADVGDWVEARAARDLSLKIDGPFAAGLVADDSNLVLRAARALAAGQGVPGAALRLIKMLPIASGIGGGSSDAAATLRALNQLWGLGHDHARLALIARDLGADVPACVGAQSALMSGTGEICEPIALPALCAVLVNPLTPMPTSEVYRQFDAMGLGRARAAPLTSHIYDASSLLAVVAAAGNDLEPAAFALTPQLREIAARLTADARVRHAALSGSGATIFALTDDGQAAASLARDLARAEPAWWIVPVRLG